MPFAKGQRWLLRSGIYILQKEDPQYGAVYSHYDSRRERHELVYAEATGYIMSLLAYLVQTQDKALVEHAKASGEWLLKWLERNEGLPAMGLWDNGTIREAYAFDAGVCCKGMLDLYQMCDDSRYLECAQRLADWLIRAALNDDGSVKPMFDMDARRFVEDRTMWYKVSGSFHAKIAMPLLQLHSIDGHERARDAALRICKWAMKQQRPEGCFPGNMHTGIISLHFHCYTVEALLYAYSLSGDGEFIAAAERGVSWIARMQRSDGTLPRWNRRGPFGGRSSDVQAQATRILSLTNMLRPRPELAAAARRASESLFRMQRWAPEVREDGGFFEGDIFYKIFPKKSPHMTSWTTMFALQAMHFVERSVAGDFALESKWLF